MPEYNKPKPAKKQTMAEKKAAAKAKRLDKKANKKLSKGYDIRAKVEASQRGETKAMSENKMSRIRKRADKKNKKGFAALKEARSLRPKPEVQTPRRAPMREKRRRDY